MRHQDVARLRRFRQWGRNNADHDAGPTSSENLGLIDRDISAFSNKDAVLARITDDARLYIIVAADHENTIAAVTTDRIGAEKIIAAGVEVDSVGRVVIYALAADRIVPALYEDSISQVAVDGIVAHRVVGAEEFDAVAIIVGHVVSTNRRIIPIDYDAWPI